MAANLKSRGIASFGKRFVNQIRSTSRSNPRDAATAHQLSPDLSGPPALTFRRATHVSAYEKNPDGDQVPPSILPNDVIHPQSDKYWGPHPQTGVFGPETEHNSSVSEERGSGEESVLEEKAFFRPTSIEDLEKPLQH